MLGLNKEFVKLKILTYKGTRPVIQSQRRISPELVPSIKKEVQRFLKAKFIRVAKYVKWLSIIVLVLNKNDKTKVYIDFRDLNKATPKDEYHIPIMDVIAKYKIFSTMDEYFEYN